MEAHVDQAFRMHPSVARSSHPALLKIHPKNMHVPATVSKWMVMIMAYLIPSYTEAAC